MKRGIIEECKEEDLDVVNTLSYKEKSKGNWKIILDSSRYNYGYKPKKSFKTNGMEELEREIRMNDYVVIIDYEECFHTIELTEETKRVCGFEVKGRYFRYKRLPFGVKSAPKMSEYHTKPIIDYFKNKGVRIGKQVDDIFICHQDKIEGDDLANELRELSKEIGFKISMKTLKGGSQKFTYMNRDINTKDLSYTMTASRIEKSINKVIDIKERDLDEVIEINRWKKKRVDKIWNGVINSLRGWGNKEVYKEIWNFREETDKKEGKVSMETKERLIELLSKKQRYYFSNEEITDRVIYSDASKEGFNLYDERDKVERPVLFEKEDKRKYKWIGHIEGLGILATIKYISENDEKERILIKTDNEAIYKMMINPYTNSEYGKRIIKDYINEMEKIKDKIILFKLIKTYENKADKNTRKH